MTGPLLDLNTVLGAVGPARLVFPAREDLVFANVETDSRLVQRGTLFVALRGERDGHDFIADAFRRGAAGVLARRLVDNYASWLPTDRPSGFAYILVEAPLISLQRLACHWLNLHRPEVVAVTGSIGKTTTKEVIADVLSRSFRVHRNERNLNTEIGLSLSLLSLRLEHEVSVLEMGMYGLGEIAALTRLARPRLGVVTNVGPNHLERLGSMERIAEAKAELVEALPPDGRAILNGDDERVRAMARLSRAPVLFYGLGPDNDLQASIPEVNGLDGISFDLGWRGEVRHVTTPLLGRHSVYACLSAAAVGLVKGMSLEQITAGLALVPSRLRLVVLPGRNGSSVIDDSYNAAPASTKAALELLASLQGRRIAVLGDMAELGSYERRGHDEVGRAAALCCDVLYVVGPRGRWIGEAAQEGGLAEVHFASGTADVDLEPAPGDVILVKASRFMRMEEVVERLRARVE